MPIPEAASLVLDAVEMTTGGEIFVLKMKSFSLGQLVDVIRGMNLAEGGFEVEEKGLIRAEKLHEDLVTADELARLHETSNHYVIAPPFGDWTPGDGMQKIHMETYNSSCAEFFTTEELVAHVRNSIIALGLE